MACRLFFLYFWLVKKDKNKAFFWLAGSTSVFIFYLFWRVLVAKVSLIGHSSIIPIASASFKERFLTVPFEFFSYLRLIFFPKDLFIAQHQVIKTVQDIRFWGTLPGVFLFFWGLFFLSRVIRRGEGGFFFFWFLISLGLVLNVFPLDMTLAERWLYFPLIGFLGLAGVFLEKFSPKKNLILVFVVVLFSVRTFLRTFDWRNGLSLFDHDIKLNSQAFDLQNNFGTELFRAGKIEEAKPHFEKSIELAPSWWTSYNNLGVVYQRKGDFGKAKELYQKAIDNGDYYLAYENLAGLKLQTEKPDKTIEFVSEALKKLPLNNNLRTILVIAYTRQGDYKKALLEAKRLLQLFPTKENRLLLEAVVRKEKI